ncbi:MAG: threonine synthase [Chloroflexota bacterium]|nr:threonine synthase [Chloroflexota bacterium]
MSQVLRQLQAEQSSMGRRPRLMERFADFLPITSDTPPLGLGEGFTPLVHARNLGRALGVPQLHLKIEGQNPTGSFKDRGMVVAVAKAIEDGARAVICASTGNTSSSAAAYAASAGIEAVIVLPKGKIAAGKMLQGHAAGARVVAIEGNFDEALRIVREMTAERDPDYPVELVNSVNPYRIEGQKTAAFEVCEDLGGAPDYLAIPVGNAGNITAYWRGFKEYRDTGLVETVPKMIGFQAEGASPLVQGHDFDDPHTVATAIRIGRPASGKLALAARDESAGLIDAVTDEEILAAYRDIARMEGIFCEPASAASIAGVRKAVADGRVDPGATIVAVLTGLGLKDPDTGMTLAVAPLEAEPTVEAVRGILGW